MRHLPGRLPLEPPRARRHPKPAFAPRHFAPPLEKLAALTEDDFRAMFRDSPVKRAKYTGFLRNVAIAMGNAGDAKFRPALEKLAASSDTRGQRSRSLGASFTRGVAPAQMDSPCTHCALYLGPRFESLINHLLDLDEAAKTPDDAFALGLEYWRGRQPLQ